MRQIVIEEATRKVINAIEIEANSKWRPPLGYRLLSVEESTGGNIGDVWDGKKFIIAEPLPEPRNLAAEIDAIKIEIEALKSG